MAKNIALTLTIGGVKQNITNIKELENAIKSAEEELKGLNIGSEGFKKLSTDVKNAKSVLEDFGESVKGQDLEKRVGAFAKVGEGITASFAGAQAAISLFGNESEAVAEAAAKAQALLTIALAARSAAEGVVAVRTVAANIATFASAAAANAATTATRVLWATLAANPLGAILAVVGALVTAYITLTDSTEEQVNVQAELNKVTSDEATGLKNSLIILTEFNGQRELQRKEIDKLVKQYPGFNAFIDKENKLNKQGLEFIKLKIKQYELEAQAKLITQKIAENSIKILEIEQRSIFDNVAWYEKLLNTVKAGGSITGAMLLDVETGFKNQREEVQKLTQENDNWRKSLGDVYVESDQVYKLQIPFNQTLEQQVKIEKDLVTSKDNAAKSQQEISEAYKKGLTATIDLSKAVDQLNKTFQDYEQTIRNLEQIKYDAPILEQLKNIKEARKQAANELVKGVEFVKKSVENLGTTLPTDILFENFVQLRENLEKNFNLIGQKGFEPFTKVYADFVANLKKEGKEVSKDQDKVFQTIVQGYKGLSDTIQDTKAFKDFVTGLTGVNVAFDDFSGGVNKAFDGAEAFQMMMGDILAANNVFVREIKESSSQLATLFQEGGTPTIEPISFDIVRLQQNAADYTRQLEKSLFKPIAERLVQVEIQAQEKLLQVARDAGDKVTVGNIEGKIVTLAKQLKSIRENGQLIAEFSETTTQQVQGNVSKIVGEFIKLATALTKSEQEILAVNQQVNELTNSLKEDSAGLSQAIGGVVLQNFETISQELFNLRTKQQKDDKDFEEKVKKDTKGLADFRIAIEKQFGKDKIKNDADLLQAYILFKKKEKEVFDETEKSKRTEAEQTLKTLETVFQQFSTSLNMISSVTQERVRTDLESLKVAEQKALTQVVGDSKTAADKRLEIQAEYEEKRKEIEKRGRISALQFSLVQSIANAAQSITALWTNPFIAANPILGAIQTAVIAGVTAAQIGIIQDQISNAQAMRRGGYLKAQGGMLLRGASHENGGIPLAQYGVIAEGNEAIINRQSTMNFQGLLSSINQSGGGRPLVMNNFDDSRIIEALAKQKQTPIRAYVLGSDITNEQMISKRLDDLSKF
jgi:hypothetical protein